MKEINSKKMIIQRDDFKNNKDVATLTLADAVVIQSGGAFEDFKELTDVYFGLDITRIGNRTFAGCTALKDVWFAITDEDKIIEIAKDAFHGLTGITFHIFASAINNKYLNDYANKHGFRVTGML